jgi:hypothetical protein
MHAIRRLVGLASALLIGGLLAGASLPAAAQGTDSLNLAIYPSSCFTLTGDPVYQLTDATRPTGAKVRALPAFSESTIAASLESLQASPFAIAVTRTGKLSGLIACGEINSVTLPDGSVAIGLREQNGSLYAGVAVLTPNGEQTTIRAYVAGALAEGADASYDDTEDIPVDDTVSVTVTDTDITADQVTLQSGISVEFIVTNNGSEPHEVMLEEAGADEVPLEFDGVQAETEDIAEGETVSFIITIDKPGDYQLADHIGDHGLVLPITVK